MSIHKTMKRSHKLGEYICSRYFQQRTGVHNNSDNCSKKTTQFLKMVKDATARYKNSQCNPEKSFTLLAIRNM